MAKLTVADVQEHNGNGNGTGEKVAKPGSGNIYMRKPTPDMLANQYVDPTTGEPDERFNRDFVLEKVKRDYIDTLKFEQQSDFIELMNDAWKWHLDESKRKKDEIVSQVIQEFQNDKEYLEALIARSQQLLKQSTK